MNAEQVTRQQLVKAWTAKVVELQRQGESARHIELFLSQLDRLPGENVAEIGHHWCLRQWGIRPVWTCLLVLLVGLASWLGAVLGGVVAALLAAGSLIAVSVAFLLHLWNHEGAFARELIARAEFATF